MTASPYVVIVRRFVTDEAKLRKPIGGEAEHLRPSSAKMAGPRGRIIWRFNH